MTQGSSRPVRPGALSVFAQLIEKIDYKTWMQHRWFWPGVAGGVALLVLLLLIVVFALRGKAKTPAKSGENRILTIARTAEGEDVFPSLQAALRHAQPGDTLVVRDETIEECIELSEPRFKKLTIQSGLESGRSVAWKCPDSPTTGALLTIREVEGIRLKGFMLDGGGQAELAVDVRGRCPGLVIEDVEVKGFTRAAFAFVECRGSTSNQLVFRRVRVLGDSQLGRVAAHAVSFLSQVKGATNHNVTFLDSRFEGPFKATIYVDSSLADVEFRRNRFFRADEAFFFEAHVPRHAFRLKIDGNTFSSINNAAFHFGITQFDSSNSLHLHNNLFHRVGKLVQVADFRDIRIPAVVSPAQWISLSRHLDAHRNASTAFFRTTFTVPDWKNITRATLDVGSPDSNISVYLNRSVVHAHTGDADAVQLVELPTKLFAERNMIALSLSRRGKATAPLVALARLTVETADGKHVVATDGKWRCTVTLPNGWENPEFDDTGWPLAHVEEKPPRNPDLPWQSAIMEELRAASRSVLVATGNVRDPNTREGNCPLDTRVEVPFDLPTNPDQPDFLMYSRDSPLYKGPDKSPGVSPQ
jgi:hypothetical protein